MRQINSVRQANEKQEDSSFAGWQFCASAKAFRAVLCTELYHSVSNKTVWPSGLRRWLQAPVRKGVGSNLAAVMHSRSKTHTAARTSLSRASIFCAATPFELRAPSRQALPRIQRPPERFGLGLFFAVRPRSASCSTSDFVGLPRSAPPVLVSRVLVSRARFAPVSECLSRLHGSLPRPARNA